LKSQNIFSRDFSNKKKIRKRFHFHVKNSERSALRLIDDVSTVFKTLNALGESRNRARVFSCAYVEHENEKLRFKMKFLRNLICASVRSPLDDENVNTEVE
jgi:hypothetical protein